MSFSARQLALSLEPRTRQSLVEISIFKDLVEAGLGRIFANPKLTLEKKFGLIDNVFADILSPEVIKFSKFLVAEKSLRKLPSTLSEFGKILDNEKKLVTGEVITASPLSDDEIKKIESRLKEKLGTEILLEPKVDPKILGGAVLKIGDKTIDNSFKRKLQSLNI